MADQRPMHEAGLPQSAFGLTDDEVAAMTEAWMLASASGDEEAAARFATGHADRLVTQLGRLWAAMRDIDEHVRAHGCACERVGAVIRAALRR